MAAHFFVGLAMLLFMVSYLSYRLENYFEDKFENRWAKELAVVSDYASTLGVGLFSETRADAWAGRTGKLLGLRVTLINSDGKVIGDSRVPLNELEALENHADRPEIVAARNSGFGKSLRFSTTVNLNLLYLAVPFNTAQNQAGFVRIAVPYSEIAETLGEIRMLIWLASGIGLILVIGIGFVSARSMTARLHTMAGAAQQMAQGDFSQKMVTTGGDEISELGEALNQMSSDLEHHVTGIKTERDQLEAILNSMIEGVLVTDEADNVLLTNPSFQKIFHLDKTVAGRSVRELFRDVKLLNAFYECRDHNKSVQVTFELHTPAKKTLQAQIARLGKGQTCSGLLVVFHDLTRLKHLEQVRSDFIANVSHELRTPLTAIKGYIETLIDADTLKREQADMFLAKVQKHTDKMTMLITDLLHLSKLESNDKPTSKEDIDLRQIVQRVAEAFSSIIENGQINLQIDFPEELPAVQGVPAEIETLLQNLIENAIKYGGDKKTIYVSARLQKNEIHVSVRDEGIGIPTEEQPRIFERFYRVDKGRSREMGGTGLGLSIVKHIVQRHGGRIWLESVLGKGATFTFSLPGK